MDQKADRLNPSAPLQKKNFDLEQTLEKKHNDVKSFNKSKNNNKEMITYFKDKYIQSEKKCEEHKILNTALKSFDAIVNIATTSSSITLSLTGFGLNAIPTLTVTACGLSSGNEVIYERVVQKYEKLQKTLSKISTNNKNFLKLITKIFTIFCN